MPLILTMNETALKEKLSEMRLKVDEVVLQAQEIRNIMEEINLQLIKEGKKDVHETL